MDTPVLDRKGRIRHHGGVVGAPGMYVLGLSFLRRRKSSFIHDATEQAQELLSIIEQIRAEAQTKAKETIRLAKRLGWKPGKTGS